MKILVISGFLGAGKTTFIKMLAEKTKKDFVVLENEYGQADIDRAVLRADTGLNIYELTEGCVCCTMKQDFATSILTISNTLDPEYLVVEPTGVAKLSNILANIKKIQYERIALLNPVTILDGNTFDDFLQAYREIYADQLETSSRIVISKMEQADSQDLQRLEQKIHSRNEKAELILSHYSGQPQEWWNSLLSDFSDPAQVHKAESENTLELETLSLTAVSLDTPTKLIAFLEAVVFGVFGKIVRAKGFLPCGEALLRFDVVNQTYAITGMNDKTEEAPSCVFIGTDLRRSWLREMLQPAYQARLPLCRKPVYEKRSSKSIRLLNSSA